MMTKRRKFPGVRCVMWRIATFTAICLDVALAVFLVAASWLDVSPIDGEWLAWITAIVLFALLNTFLVVAGQAIRRSRNREEDHSEYHTKRTLREVGFWVPVTVASVLGVAIGVWGGYAVNGPQRARQQKMERENELKLGVGDLVPEMDARTLEGSEWRLADHGGRPVMLHFWASWDDESIGSLLRMRRLYEEYEGVVDVVSVCLDRQPESLRELREEFGIEWPQLFDPEKGWESSVATAFSVQRVPQVWIIGKDRNVVARNLQGRSIDERVVRFLRDDRMLGQPAPEIESRTLDGDEWRLSEQQGSVVLVDFWATWCGPCLAEIPNLKAIQKRFGARDDFLMVGLSLDAESEPLRKCCVNEEIGWLQLHEPGLEFDQPAVKAYEVNGIPSIWLIDRDGLVIGIDLRGEEIAIAIEKALE